MGLTVCRLLRLESSLGTTVESKPAGQLCLEPVEKASDKCHRYRWIIRDVTAADRMNYHYATRDSLSLLLAQKRKRLIQAIRQGFPSDPARSFTFCMMTPKVES